MSIGIIIILVLISICEFNILILCFLIFFFTRSAHTDIHKFIVSFHIANELTFVNKNKYPSNTSISSYHTSRVHISTYGKLYLHI